jgi:hypothetical protein
MSYEVKGDRLIDAVWNVFSDKRFRRVGPSAVCFSARIDGKWVGAIVAIKTDILTKSSAGIDRDCYDSILAALDEGRLDAAYIATGEISRSGQIEIIEVREASEVKRLVECKEDKPGKHLH